MTRITVAALVLLISTAANAQDRPDWIKERERMWESIEAECGADVPPVDDLDAKLQACKAARTLGRTPGTIMIGDTQEYVKAQWGAPDRTQSMVSQYGVTEWWIYHAHTVKFHNGVVEILHTH